jgi:hypothetical protein
MASLASSSPSLKAQALQLLLQNLAHESFPVNITVYGTNLTFSTPCFDVAVQESTSTLLAARALAKAGHTTLAWQSLLAFFDGQDSITGFLPQYRYYNPTSADQKYYLDNSTIPGPKLGLYLAALPLHASLVLDVFSLSPQEKRDLTNLKCLYQCLLRYHAYMMERQLAGRVHPWETLWDFHSWVDPLEDVRQEIKARKWKMPFEIPQLVSRKYNFLKNVYEPSVYLLLEKCRHNMTLCRLYDSVEHAAIWAQAHLDLDQMHAILAGRHILADPVPKAWLRESREFLSKLWSTNHNVFLPQYANKSLPVSDATSFVGLWSQLDNVSQVSSLASKLLQHGNGDFDFDCGPHAIWSRGACPENAYISPLLNYLVTIGLRRNNVDSIGYYLSNATTNQLFDTEAPDVIFAEALNATSGRAFASMDVCALQSTATAAVVVDLLIPDPPRVFIADPPIRTSGVIVIVILELVVAFAVGASCLLLSLKVLREFQLSSQVSDAALETGYYSAASSFEENNGNNEEIPKDDVNGAYQQPLLSMNTSL